jgi:hypothetical protein
MSAKLLELVAVSVTDCDKRIKMSTDMIAEKQMEIEIIDLFTSLPTDEDYEDRYQEVTGTDLPSDEKLAEIKKVISEKIAFFEDFGKLVKLEKLIYEIIGKRNVVLLPSVKGKYVEQLSVIVEKVEKLVEKDYIKETMFINMANDAKTQYEFINKVCDYYGK